MASLRQRIRRRPARFTLIVFGIVAVLGSLLTGTDFLIQPLPIPDFAASIWFTFNAILFAVTAGLTYRNLERYLDRWTWQERAVSRGLLLILSANAFGLGVRIFMEPFLTLATPVNTVGLAFLIYGLIGKPLHLGNLDD